MRVPKTAIDKQNSLMLRKNHIRATGESAAMQAVSKTTRMEGFANLKFGVGILSTNPGHHPTACRFIDDISHGRPREQTPVLPVRERLFRYVASSVAPRIRRPVRQQHCQTGGKPGYPKRGSASFVHPAQSP